MAEDKKKLKSPLKKKIVELVLVEKRPNEIMKSGADVTLLQGSTRSFRLGKKPGSEYLLDPLTEEEREYLESILGFNLSIYARDTDDDPNFWVSARSSRIKLTRTGTDLDSATLKMDLNDPIGFIRWKICLIDPVVANKWAERDEPQYVYALRDIDDMDDEIKSKIDKEDVVLEYLFKNKKGKKKMFDLLRLYGASELTQTLSYTQTANWMYNQLRNLSHSSKHIAGLYNIISLTELELEGRTFLKDALTCGVIVKVGEEFRLSGGGVLGGTEYEAMKYLNEPEYNNTKLRVQEAIDTYYKTKK